MQTRRCSFFVENSSGSPSPQRSPVACPLSSRHASVISSSGTPAQLFWIIKNGIKMTGMGSYGAVHKDEEIWNLVAFVQRLPKMTPEQYGQMEQASAAGR
jgi:hypothetical protein